MRPHNQHCMLRKKPKEESHMARSDKTPSDTETIMIALDQISQTIDVMTSVVGRLRNYMQEQQATAADQATDLQVEMRADRTLH